MSVEFTDNTAKIKAALSEGLLDSFTKQVVKYRHRPKETAGLIPDKQRGLTNIWLMKEKMNQLLL